jgi:hypothetical protein
MMIGLADQVPLYKRLGKNREPYFPCDAEEMMVSHHSHIVFSSVSKIDLKRHITKLFSLL